MAQVGKNLLEFVKKRKRQIVEVSDDYCMTLILLPVTKLRILQERKYGRIRMYRFNEGTAKAKAVAALIEVWEKNDP